MALIHEWARASTSANNAGTALSMAARDGFIADLQQQAEAWYRANSGHVFVRRKILFWVVVAKVGELRIGSWKMEPPPILWVLRQMFGDDFAVDVPNPAPVEA